MRKKIKISYLLLGIGVGIIITGIIYSAFPKVEYVDLNDEMIIEKAKDLGMTNIKDSLVMEDSHKEEPEQKTEEKLKPGDEYKDIIIEEGEILQDIVDKLYDNGLIDNKEEFILLAEDKMVDKKFVYGKYRIKYNTSYSTIIKMLTEIVK